VLPRTAGQLHPRIDPAPLPNYATDRDHYDKGSGQRWDVMHNHILLRRPNKRANYANQLTAPDD